MSGGHEISGKTAGWILGNGIGGDKLERESRENLESRGDFFFHHVAEYR
jgi:hypothetical protein